MNKTIIFAVTFLFMMSFIVESVSAVEASEVLKARLTVIKNNLKAAESKVQTAKVDVGVGAGVGVGADATKTAIKAGLDSQTRLISKNSILRKTPQTAPQTVPQSTPQTAQAQSEAQTTSTAQNQQATEVTKPQQTQQTTQQTAIPQSPAQSPVPSPAQTQTQAQAKEVIVNITAVIDEYVGQLESQVTSQIEAIQKAIAAVRQAEKESQLSYAAKLLAKIQALDEAVAKAAESQAKYQEKQNARIEQNKKVVIQFIADTKKQAAEAKAKLAEEIETLIAAIKPHLEEAENLYMEKKENATIYVLKALKAINKALKAVTAFQYHALKTQLLLRYPKTCEGLALYADKVEKQINEISNVTQQVEAQAQAQAQKLQAQAQAQVNKPIENTPRIASLMEIKKQRSAAAVEGHPAIPVYGYYGGKGRARKSSEPESNPAVLVALNTNKLKQKLSQLH